MNFWDTSAIVPLVVDEATSARVRRTLVEDPDVLVWWGTRVECASALARMRRVGTIADEVPALARLERIAGMWREVEPTERVRQDASRLIRVHDGLRAGDALQLGAAIVGSDRRPGAVGFVCLDERLRAAAAREGFRLSP